MTKFQLNRHAIATFGRINGIRGFLEFLDKMPEIEFDERERVRDVAEAQGVDEADYDFQRQVLAHKFGHWIPRFSAYSVLILLHGVVEMQLAACADHVCTTKGIPLKPSDIRGTGIQASLLYLERLGGIDVKALPGHADLYRLRDLRHLLAHRIGTKGSNQEHQRVVADLVKAYPGLIEFPDKWPWWYGEAWISMRLCRQFIDSVEGFMTQLFNLLGLPTQEVTTTE